jgi:succinate dehydrogenase hydrophobic anchor subunit
MTPRPPQTRGLRRRGTDQLPISKPAASTSTRRSRAKRGSAQSAPWTHCQGSDTTFSSSHWRAASEPAKVASRVVPAPLRVAHGVSALALVMIFLALHFANHLMFPAGVGTYDAVMKVFRHVYRTDILQPLVVALFLFQIGTGLFFVWRLTTGPSDRFRTFQIASGVYLAFYVLGHMDSVFIFARTYLAIDTGWSFATGAPTGLVKDPWNIRLVPHYWLGVFFLLAHLVAGARAVIMAHGVSKALADRFMVGGAVGAGIVATVIMLGMCGMRIQFI